MTTRTIACLLATSLLATPLLAAPKHEKHARRSEPARVVSVSQSGSSVIVHLENDKSVEVPAAHVRVIHAASHTSHKKAAAVSLSTLTSSTNAAAGTPAVATFLYRRDGTIRKARIEVFDSTDQMSASLHHSGKRVVSSAHRPNQ